MRRRLPLLLVFVAVSGCAPIDELPDPPSFSKWIIDNQRYLGLELCAEADPVLHLVIEDAPDARETILTLLRDNDCEIAEIVEGPPDLSSPAGTLQITVQIRHPAADTFSVSMGRRFGLEDIYGSSRFRLEEGSWNLPLPATIRNTFSDAEQSN